MAIARHVVVSGRVQGVGYRAFVADLAARHGAVGWVRNRRDGTVEAVLAGDDAALADMLTQLRAGPPAALVDDLAISPAQDTPAPPDFRVLPTA